MIGEKVWNIPDSRKDARAESEECLEMASTNDPGDTFPCMRPGSSEHTIVANPFTDLEATSEHEESRGEWQE